MKKLSILLSLCLCVISIAAIAQVKTPSNIWETLLNDVKIKYVYAANYKTYLPWPKFGDELKKLDGTEIPINGFFLPVDVTGSVFVISYNPMNMCFFCTGSGIETIVEINAPSEHIDKFKRLKTDNYIRVKGTLQLNKNDFEHLVYILNNAELIEIIK